MTTSETSRFQTDALIVHVLPDSTALAAEAASRAGTLIRTAILNKGRARVVFSAANSQLEMVRLLTAMPDIDWQAVEVFHVDEYEGVDPDSPISFRRWVREQVVERVKPGTVHYLAGDAANIEQECARYGALLAAEPIDVALLGFGENCHIGFNDPHEADFHDPLPVRRVTLDERCRLQQYEEGHFTDPALVPRVGLTLSCPTLVSAAAVVCCVPGHRKAEAVRNALELAVSESYPGSILRAHQNAHLFLDSESAALLARQDEPIARG